MTGKRWLAAAVGATAIVAYGGAVAGTCGCVVPGWNPTPSGTSPSSLSFGSQDINNAATASQTETITNTGGSTLTFTSVTITGTNANEFTITNNACTGTIAGKASCTIQVAFDPITTGAKTASLVVADNATGSPQTIPLSGTGTSSGGSQFSGPFNCYGVQTLPSSCYSLSTCTGGADTVTTSGQLTTAIGNATGGEVICLDGNGSFTAGTITQTPSSTVTIQPAPGRTPTLSVNFSAANHWKVLGVTIQGPLDIAESRNVQVIHSTWVQGSEGGKMDDQTNIANTNDLFDYDNFTNTVAIQSEARISFDGPNFSSVTTGFTISHSLIAGEYGGNCSDGIDTYGGYGSVIGPGNEFTGIDQSPCTNGAHADPIAAGSSNGNVVIGNYFHGNGTGSGGIFQSFDNWTVTNNVFLTDIGYSCVGIRASTNSRFTHNYVGVDCSMDTTFNPGPPPYDGPDVGDTFTNNNFQSTGRLLLDNGSNQPNCCTEDYNLNSGYSGAHDVTGTPTYQGGGGYYNWVIVSGPGYHAGSDGKSMGITG